MHCNVTKVLDRLEPTIKDFWNIPKESGLFINSLIKAANYKNILEIGTSNGYSATWIAEALQHTGGHLTTIEFHNKRIVLAEANLKEAGLFDYVTIKQGSALDVLDEILEDSSKPEFDLAFIDAGKAEYIHFFKKVHQKLRKNGILLADNVTSHQEKVQDFLDEINNHPDYQVSMLNYQGGLLLAVKTV